MAEVGKYFVERDEKIFMIDKGQDGEQSDASCFFVLPLGLERSSKFSTG